MNGIGKEDPGSARVLIFAGGSLGEWALRDIRPNDLLVGADRGALFLVRNGFEPDLALGDFDSVTAEELEEIRRNSKSFLDCDPVHKDWTDTEMAFNWAMEQKPSEIMLLGALGTRLDHSLANVHLLRRGLQRGIRCSILDAHNYVTLIDRFAMVANRGFAHVSLLPLSLEVRGITLHGFQYPLQRAALTLGQSLGISNVLVADPGMIEVEEGLLLVIQSKD